ncbi:DUF4232 domain-containing protein [Kitasatospora sp. LaBMicrA B282]|uniref:DUF4232 domain-containing protein n=1 Tax=Kitasatospora sp. LaBMicrA B282 TaxID=3420949 RepID=UPI003D0A7820
MRISQLATAVTVALVAGLGLTACGPADSPAAAPAAAPTASAAAASTAHPVTTLPPAQGTKSPAGPATPAGDRCHSSDLSLDVIMGPQDGGASGTGDFTIELINKSARTCTLHGYPGVELLDQSGHPLGMKDVRNPQFALSGDGQVTTQTLSRGSADPTKSAASAAYVRFDTKEPGATAGYPRALKVQVIPPDETQPLVAPITMLDAPAGSDSSIMVTSTTLTIGPMDVDAPPHG